MTMHRILNAAEHGALRVHAAAGAAFGDAVMSCVAVPAEFQRLACEYPLLFVRDAERQTFSALALFGFEPGENLFLSDAGWEAVSRPLAMAVQPFLVGRPRDGEGAAQVHIDMAHPRIAQGEGGVPLFDGDGKPTGYLEQVAELLGQLDEGWRASDAFHAALDRYALLEPFSMDVTLASGAMHRMVGYHLIDEGNVARLEPAVLAELHAAGHLAPIYMAMASIGNLAKLVHRKNARGNG